MRFIKQLDATDCGPACLNMIANWYGRSFSLEYLRNETCISKEGVSLSGISKAAEKLGTRPFCFMD